MLFSKMMGIAVLLGCGALTSLLWIKFEQSRCRQAEAFIDLIRNIRLQIDCFGTPLSKILDSLDDKLYEMLGAPHAPDFEGLLAGTVLLVDRDFRKILQDFSASLGTGYREEELRYCDYYLTRLQPLAQKTRDELEKRTRLALILPPAILR